MKIDPRLVHAVLAGGVTHPHLIEQWKSPDGLTYPMLETVVRGLDLDALRKFAGLNAKVRHSAVRTRLPFSFRLMSITGLEIDVFSAYACECSRAARPFAASVEQRAKDLIEFLRGWLDHRRSTHLMLWDLIRHEQAISTLSSPTDLRAEPESSARIGASTLVTLVGAVELVSTKYDPLQLIAALQEREPNIRPLRRSELLRCYWCRSDEGEIAMLSVDAATFHIVSELRGTVRVSDVAWRVCGGRRPGKSLLAAISQLHRLGLVHLRSEPIQ